MRKLSFVIPCYRSEHTISNVVQGIINTVKTRSEYTYEIILVSDHSPDNVFQVIKELACQNKNVKGIELAKNFGQHAALMAGYRECTGDIVISLDDDGQTPEVELFSLIDKLDEGFDVVYGAYPSIKQTFFRIFGSRVNKFMMEKLIGKPKNIESNSYFACRDYIVAEMLRYKNSYPYIGGLIFRATNNIANVTIKQRERIEGHSGYNIIKLLSLWMNGFTAFSVKPLRIATLTGVICAAVGFIFGVYTIIHKLMNPTTPAGWSSTMAALLFIGGMIMLVLGLIGEYIGRIYICINNSPQYVIRDTVNIEQNRKLKGNVDETTNY